MKYRKIRADQVFDGYKFQKDAVLIVDKSGRVEDLVSVNEAGADVERVQGLLTPGFINCHCHLELSHMRGRIPEKTGLVDFVFKVVTERHHSADEIAQAIASAEEEMRNNGIVGVGDVCNNSLTLAQKQQGRLRYYNFIEASGWLPSIAPARFEQARAVYESFSGSKSNRFHSSIVPHAAYSVSENLWKQIQPAFQNKVVSIHNQETAFEDEFFLKGTGDFQRMYRLMNVDNAHHQPTRKSSLQSYFDKLKEAANVILVHNTFIKQEDVDYVRGEAAKGREKNTQPATPKPKPQTFFCLCVNANLYIENVLPPVDLLRKNNSSIVLGTDSLASNWSLNILDEIKTIRKNFPAIPLEELLQWATSNGAKALQMDDEFGSFEKGKRPGVMLISNKLDQVQKLV